MRKVNIANFVIYDLANRFYGTNHSDMDKEIVDLVADTWNKKHFISATHNAKNHHNEKIRQKFVM